MTTVPPMSLETVAQYIVRLPKGSPQRDFWIREADKIIKALVKSITPPADEAKVVTDA